MAMSLSLEINEVEDYLKENRNKKLALRTIYRDLKMKRRKTLWLINQSKNIVKVKSHEVGSGKHTIHVYTYVE
tara:strand:+ start:133 stop:351 length:219 start_codon:yes stop_codon:yes gene_type:complete